MHRYSPVASGDTLNLISSVYGVPVAVIQRLNDLHPDSVIYPGEALRVPSPLHATTHTVAPGGGCTSRMQLNPELASALVSTLEPEMYA